MNRGHRFIGHLWDNLGYFGILWDSMGSFKDSLRFFKGHYGILNPFQQLLKVSDHFLSHGHRFIGRLWDDLGYFGILWDPLRVLWDSSKPFLGFLTNSKSFLTLLTTFWASVNNFVILSGSVGCFGMFWDSMGFSKGSLSGFLTIFRSFSTFLATFWATVNDSKRFSVVPWTSTGSFGIFWDFMGFYRILKRPYQDSWRLPAASQHFEPLFFKRLLTTPSGCLGFYGILLGSFCHPSGSFSPT